LKGTYGGTGCAPIWNDVISTALKDEPVKDFSRPDGIVWATVDAKSGKLPSELTPQEFVTQEIFARGTVPTEVSDVWVKGEVCAETGKLPTPFCPEIITKVFLQRPIPYTGTPKPEDAELEPPAEECTLHGIGSSVQIRICTDPRHHGTPYLANVPVGNQEGGCPPEYIEIQTFSMGNVPQEYCSIPEHQIEGGGKNSGPPVVSLKGDVSQTAGGENYEIDLQWEMTPYPGHIIYSIERWTEDKPTKYNVAMTTKKSWTDKKVRNNTVYYYRVTAIDSNSKVRIPSNDIRIVVQGSPQ